MTVRKAIAIMEIVMVDIANTALAGEGDATTVTAKAVIANTDAVLVATARKYRKDVVVSRTIEDTLQFNV